MRNSIGPAQACCLLALCGCSPAFKHSPIDVEKPQVDERLLGTWYHVPEPSERDAEGVDLPYVVSRPEDAKLPLKLTFDEKGETKALNLQTCKLGEQWLLCLNRAELKQIPQANKNPGVSRTRRDQERQKETQERMKKDEEEFPFVLAGYQLREESLTIFLLNEDLLRAGIRTGKLKGVPPSKRWLAASDTRITATSTELREFLTATADKLLDAEPMLKFSRKRPPAPRPKDVIAQEEAGAVDWKDERKLPAAKVEEIDPRLVGTWRFTVRYFLWFGPQAGIEQKFSADGTAKMTSMVEGHAMGGILYDWRLVQRGEKSSEIRQGEGTVTVEFLSKDRIRIGDGPEMQRVH